MTLMPVINLEDLDKAARDRGHLKLTVLPKSLGLGVKAKRGEVVHVWSNKKGIEDYYTSFRASTGEGMPLSVLSAFIKHLDVYITSEE